ncbi:hypothetical protein ELS19_03395 [Halogeometricum borinquense]|uniref:Uncharacterized protein n=1 Tax=Halogeometricum borinquense TaxID=60847 RepID=A0A482TCQ5_9EURY|nr:hypothetical protein [Halogeometricum borinquense]RYJ13108.1 hypothetical protein ELS19_03395 [Halogeometricum borinquense]
MAATVGVSGLGAASESSGDDVSKFDPSDHTEVIEAYNTLKQMPEKKAEDIWVDDLSNNQTDSIINLIKTEMEAEFTTVESESVSALSEYQRQSVVEKAYGGIKGVVGQEYVLEHHLNWEYNGSDYRDANCDAVGNPSGLFASYVETIQETVVEYDDYFVSKVAGKFALDPPDDTNPVEVLARINIKGYPDGDHRVAKKQAPLV